LSYNTRAAGREAWASDRSEHQDLNSQSDVAALRALGRE
jgi:hypothetical protein